MQASRPGSGAFLRLLQELERDYPNKVVFVECVLNNRFAEKLCREQWVEQAGSLSPSFFKVWPT